jgi:hypothetical protein
MVKQFASVLSSGRRIIIDNGFNRFNRFNRFKLVRLSSPPLHV